MLDVACGSGRHVRWLAARGHRRHRRRPRRRGDGAAATASPRRASPTSRPAPWPLAGRTLRRGASSRTTCGGRCCRRSSAAVAAGGVLLYETFAAGNETRRQAVAARFPARARRTAGARRGSARRRLRRRLPRRPRPLRAAHRRGARARRRGPRALSAAPPGARRTATGSLESTGSGTATPMKPITGSIVALVTPMHDDGSVDYRRAAPPDRLAHRRRHATASASSAPPASRRRSRVEEHCEIIRVAVEHAARPRAGDGRHRRQLHRRGDRALALRAQGRRRLHAVGRALLQQAVAGRHLPALPRHRRGGRHPDGALQRARPHRRRHAAPRPCCAWRRCPASSASRKPPATSSAPLADQAGAARASRSTPATTAPRSR